MYLRGIWSDLKGDESSPNNGQDWNPLTGATKSALIYLPSRWYFAQLDSHASVRGINGGNERG